MTPRWYSCATRKPVRKRTKRTARIGNMARFVKAGGSPCQSGGLSLFRQWWRALAIPAGCAAARLHDFLSLGATKTPIMRVQALRLLEAGIFCFLSER